MDEEKSLSIQTRNILGEIREFITHPNEVVNKAMLFDRKVLEAGKLVGPQLLTALVGYNKKMEATLEQLREVMVEVRSNTIPTSKPETASVPEPKPQVEPAPKEEERAVMEQPKDSEAKDGEMAEREPKQ